MKRISIDALLKYVDRMKRTNSSPCYIPTDALNLLLSEIKISREAIKAAECFMYHYQNDSKKCYILDPMQKFEQYLIEFKDEK